MRGDRAASGRTRSAVTSYDLVQEITFDPVTCTATDSWWPAGTPEMRICQVLRCYTPADLRLLLGGTGLVLQEASLDHAGQHEYPARLAREE